MEPADHGIHPIFPGELSNGLNRVDDSCVRATRYDDQPSIRFNPAGKPMLSKQRGFRCIIYDKCDFHA